MDARHRNRPVVAHLPHLSGPNLAMAEEEARQVGDGSDEAVAQARKAAQSELAPAWYARGDDRSPRDPAYPATARAQDAQPCTPRQVATEGPDPEPSTPANARETATALMPQTGVTRRKWKHWGGQ